MDSTVLTYLNKQDSGSWKNSWEIANELQLNHDDVVGGLKSLQTK